MLGAGITSVAEFFYLNGAGNDHAESAIRAARDTGIRLVLARTWMDAPYAPAAFRESVEQAAARTRDLMQAHPEANVCVAPHSLHAASPEMIQAAAAFARDCDCMLHIHVAEAAYEGEETLARFGAPPVTLLEQLGRFERTDRRDSRDLSLRGGEEYACRRGCARRAQSHDEPVSGRRHLRRRGTARARRSDWVRHGCRRPAFANRRDARRGVAAKTSHGSMVAHQRPPSPLRWQPPRVRVRWRSMPAISSTARRPTTSCSMPRASMPWSPALNAVVYRGRRCLGSSRLR